MWAKKISLVATRVTAVVAVVVFMLGTVTPVLAEGRYVRVDGRVQWISADKMMVIPDGGGVPVSIDLRRVPQEQYATLAQGNGVVVDGVISADGRLVLATSVKPAGGWEERADERSISVRPR
jgi:hypothetical protein